MTYNFFFWAFILVCLAFGWYYSGRNKSFNILYEIIDQLRLERDAQARTIQWQRKVIAELENKVNKDKLGAFRAEHS